MKQYELVLVLEGKATAAKKKSLTERIEKLVAALEGKILESSDWGVKELAYPILKNTTGSFLLMTVELGGKGAKDMLNRLRLEEGVIRSLFIVKEEPMRLVSSKVFKHTTDEHNDQES